MKLLAFFARRQHAQRAAASTPVQPVPDEGVQLFEDGLKGAEKAWTGQGLLGMSREDLVQRSLSTLQGGTGAQISALLADMAHESWLAATPGRHNFDAAKAARLTAIVSELLAGDVAAGQSAPRDPNLVAEQLIDAARRWVREGEGEHPDLKRIAEFVSGGSLMRTSLIVPLAPVLVALRSVARASQANFNFSAAPRASAAAGA